MNVSTHSRLKAAGAFEALVKEMDEVSTHSRLKAAGSDYPDNYSRLAFVSTHSRLKAAGKILHKLPDNKVSFNTQPPKGGW